MVGTCISPEARAWASDLVEAVYAYAELSIDLQRQPVVDDQNPAGVILADDYPQGVSDPSPPLLVWLPALRPLQQPAKLS